MTPDLFSSARMTAARLLRHADRLRGVYRMQRLLASPSLLARHPQIVDVPYPIRPEAAEGSAAVWRGHTAEFIGWNAWYRGHYELETLAALAALLRPGMRAVEVGANRGYHTIFAGTCVGRAGKVLAFEPNETPRRTLEENLARLGWNDRIELRTCALGAAPGQATFYAPLTTAENQGMGGLIDNSGQPTEAKVVSVSTLDTELAGSPCDFIKMDVQGAEGTVLRGAAETLKRCAPRVYFEVEHSEPGCHEAIDLLRSGGYSVWRIRPTHKPPYALLRPLPKNDRWTATSNCLALLPQHRAHGELPFATEAE